MSSIKIEIELPAECTAPLDNLVENGAYGSTREVVVRHFICSRLGVDPSKITPPVSKKKTTKKKTTKKS